MKRVKILSLLVPSSFFFGGGGVGASFFVFAFRLFVFSFVCFFIRDGTE